MPKGTRYLCTNRHLARKITSASEHGKILEYRRNTRIDATGKEYKGIRPVAITARRIHYMALEEAR